MGAPIVVPFNFQPASTTIKTASYTIPAGRYARIVPYSGLTLNSVPTAPSYTVSGSGVTNISSIDVFSGNGCYVDYTLTKSNSGSQLKSISAYALFSDGATAGTTFRAGSRTLVSTSANGASTGTLYIPSGVYFSANVTSVISGAVSYSLIITPIEVQPFWVKEGDVIDGDRFLVEEFNAIS